VFANVVDQKGADCAPIVGGGDSTVPLLAGSIPDLCLDGLRIDLDGSSGKLYADGGLGIQVELIASETAQEVGFTNARISDQHDCGGISKGEAEQRKRAAGTFEEKLWKRTALAQLPS